MVLIERIGCGNLSFAAGNVIQERLVHALIQLGLFVLPQKIAHALQRPLVGLDRTIGLPLLHRIVVK